MPWKRTAGFAELVRVGITLVAEHVRLAVQHQRGRQTGQLFLGSPQRRRGDLRPLLRVGRVLVPEPLHAVAAQEVASGELLVRFGVEVRVRDRVEQHLVDELRPAALLGDQRDGCGHIAADAVAGDGQPPAVQGLFRALAGHPLGDRIGLLDGRRILRLGGQHETGENDGGIRADGDEAHQPVVRVGVAEDPARLVDEEDRRQGALGSHGPRNTNGDRAGRPALGLDFLDVHVRLIDRAGLHLIDDLPALCRRQVEQEGVG